jgi:glyoxylate carboligase
MDRNLPSAQTMTGRATFLKLLSSEGITHLFGNPGTTELPIMDALSHHPQIQYVLGLQEAVVMAMADGYARHEPACRRKCARGAGAGQRNGGALQRQVLRLAGVGRRRATNKDTA